MPEEFSLSSVAPVLDALREAIRCNNPIMYGPILPLPQVVSLDLDIAYLGEFKSPPWVLFNKKGRETVRLNSNVVLRPGELTLAEDRVWSAVRDMTRTWIKERSHSLAENEPARRFYSGWFPWQTPAK